ncbi:MAG: YjbQ family protein [Anaerolineaceae bacterium]|nr:YjbQ family protein [Anaerolineaceae bacterium]
MIWHIGTLDIPTNGKGLYPITRKVARLLEQWSVVEGMCYLYMPHTSASLVINENYDPSAQQDMENMMEHLVPEGQAWYVHTAEGRDDAPSHLRAMLTNVSLTIPIDNGRLSLGTWQGIYLFEHRARPHQRQVLVRALDTGRI